MIRRFLLVLVLGLSVVVAQDNGQRSAEDFVRDGDFNFERGDCSFAQYFYQQALELEPELTPARIGKGKSLVCQRAYETGIAEFEAVLNQEPDNVEALIQLAQAYQEQYSSDPERYAEQLDQAMRILERAEAQAPDDAEVLNLKGVILFRLGDLEAARTALERAVSQLGNSDLDASDQALVHINLGSTYRQLDQLEQALQAFRRAVSLNPNSATAHNNVGDTYFRLGECEDAIYELNQATSLNPNLLDAAANLAITMFECGQVEASIEKFERALNIPGALNLPPLYTYASRAYVEQGRFDEAVRRAQQGALLPPSSAEAYFYLGQAYEARNASGDRDSAREAYEQALEINPNFQPAQEALSRLGS